MPENRAKPARVHGQWPDWIVYLLVFACAVVPLVVILVLWLGDGGDVIALVGIAAALLLLLLLVPTAQVTRSIQKHGGKAPTTGEFLRADNEARRTWAEIVGAIGIMVGLMFTFQQLQDTREAQEATQRLSEQTLRNQGMAQASDRFVKTTELLGDPSSDARLGAIYGLERLAYDVPDQYYWPALQVLAGYVRQHAPVRVPAGAPPEPRLLIQAALDVIGRRGAPPPEAGGRWKLDLAAANLAGLDLAGASLEGADLSGSALEGASLAGADLTGADLTRARLRSSLPADLAGACLAGANLTDADVSIAQIEAAIIDEDTTLPQGMEATPDAEPCPS